MRGKLTGVCNDASGIRHERPNFLAMKGFVSLLHKSRGGSRNLGRGGGGGGHKKGVGAGGGCALPREVRKLLAI